MLIADDDRTLGETLAGLVRWWYRYRSELAPVTLAGAMFVTAALVHVQYAHVWPWLAVLTVVAVVGLLVVPGRWIPGWAVLDYRIERVYAAIVVATVGGWLVWAVLVGPWTRPLPLVLLGATVVVGVPWWTHRRRRAGARVERILDGWPRVAEVTGLAGSRVTSALVSAWGYTARLALTGGHTVRTVVDKIPAIESALGTRPGAIRVEPDSTRADRAILRVVEHDPHAHPIGWPTNTAVDSINRPVQLGVWEDGTPVTVSLLRRHVLVGGVMGSGKSGVLNIMLAVLTGCRDVLLWGIDLKQGMELRPWTSCLGRLATTPAEAVTILRAGVTELNRRAAQLAEQGQRQWQPTPDHPALVIVVDEYAELCEQAHDMADSIARRGRAVAVTLLVATQRPTQDAMGNRAVRSQMDVRICLRVRERRDADLILGGAGMITNGWHADTLDAPGKFLLSAPGPEHATPRRARAYQVTDHHVDQTARRNTSRRPANPPSQPDEPPEPTAASSMGGAGDTGRAVTDGRPAASPAGSGSGPEVVLWRALLDAPEGGVTVGDLMTVTGMGRTWVYDRLKEHHRAGRAIQTYRGRWRATTGSHDG